jgi:hypothetical protein
MFGRQNPRSRPRRLLWHFVTHRRLGTGGIPPSPLDEFVQSPTGGGRALPVGDRPTPVWLDPRTERVIAPIGALRSSDTSW